MRGSVTSGAGTQKSILVLDLIASCFCSVALPLRTSLQMPQGCTPSKVLATATEIGASLEYSTTMLTQATDCKSAQCPPTEKISNIATTELPKRLRTSSS